LDMNVNWIRARVLLSSADSRDLSAAALTVFFASVRLA
jgi:hypothetical protein